MCYPIHTWREWGCFTKKSLRVNRNRELRTDGTATFRAFFLQRFCDFFESPYRGDFGGRIAIYVMGSKHLRYRKNWVPESSMQRASGHFSIASAIA